MGIRHSQDGVPFGRGGLVCYTIMKVKGHAHVVSPTKNEYIPHIIQKFYFYPYLMFSLNAANCEAMRIKEM